MNFLCDKCKQKYHVADEKIRGRAVTRFRCKKCENIIELVNPNAAPGDAPPGTTQDSVSGILMMNDPAAPGPSLTGGPVRRPSTMTTPAVRVGASATASSSASAGAGPSAATTRPAPPATTKPRPTTATGPSFGAVTSPTGRPVTSGNAARGPTLSGAPRTSGSMTGDNGWYAGIRDLPVGPLTRKELANRVQNGDVTPETLVWREGLDDWRALRNVAELADLLRVAQQRANGAPPPATPARATPARPGPFGRNSRPELDEDEEATRVAGVDPILAAAIPRPSKRTPEPRPAEVKPAETKPAETKAGEQPTMKLPRMNDRLAEKLTSPRASGVKPAEGLASRLSAPAPKTTESAPPKPPSEPPTVPISSVPGAQALLMEEALRAASSDRVTAPSPAPGTATQSAPPIAPSASSSAFSHTAKTAPDPFAVFNGSSAAREKGVDLEKTADLDALAEMLAASPAARPSTPAPSTPSDAPPTGNTLPPVTPTIPGTGQGATASAEPIAPTKSAPTPEPYSLATHTDVTRPLPPPPERVEREIPAVRPLEPPPVVSPRRESQGLPKSAWILMAGVLVVGIVGGILISKLLAPPPDPSPQQPPSTPRIEPSPSQNTPSTPTPPTTPTTPGTAPITPPPTILHPGTPAPTTPRPGDHGGSRPTTGQLSAQDLARLRAEQQNMGVPAGPVGVPVGSTQLRNPSPGTQGSSQTPAQRGAAILNAFRNSRVVDGCWQALLRQNPAVRGGTVTIDVGVNSNGRFTNLNVSNSPDARFDTCLRSRLATISPIGAGEAMDARTSVNLTLNN